MLTISSFSAVLSVCPRIALSWSLPQARNQSWRCDPWNAPTTVPQLLNLYNKGKQVTTLEQCKDLSGQKTREEIRDRESGPQKGEHSQAWPHTHASVIQRQRPEDSQACLHLMLQASQSHTEGSRLQAPPFRMWRTKVPVPSCSLVLLGYRHSCVHRGLRHGSAGKSLFLQRTEIPFLVPDRKGIFW